MSNPANNNKLLQVAFMVVIFLIIGYYLAYKIYLVEQKTVQFIIAMPAIHRNDG